MGITVTSTTTTTTTTNNNTSGSNDYERRDLCLLATGVITFFTIHNYLQEAIMKRPNFTYGWSLGLLEMYGTCFFSFVERVVKKRKEQQQQQQHVVVIASLVSATEEEEEKKKLLNNTIIQQIMTYILGGVKSKTVLTDYLIVSFCLASSSSLSSIALNYINFPTKVVFRSCKLLPTMTIAILLHNKTFSPQEWYAAIMVCIGLTMVGLADAHNLGTSFHPLGLILVSTSVLADAITPNIQQRLFGQGENRPDVVYSTNLIASVIMTGALLYSGDLLGTIVFAQEDTTSAFYMVVYACVAYVAVSFHMLIVQKYGGVVGVLVGNTRKVVTIVLSFLLFPKPVSGMYVLGVVCSLGGLTAAMVLREQQKKKEGKGKGGTIGDVTKKVNRKDSDLEEEMKSLILSPSKDGGGGVVKSEDVEENGAGEEEEESWFEGGLILSSTQQHHQHHHKG